MKIKWLQYPKFQIPLILLNLSIFLVLGLTSFFGLWLFLKKLPELGLSVQQVKELRIWLAAMISVGFLLTAFVGGTLTFILSYRLAQPILSLKDYFRRVSTVNPRERLPFSKKGFFPDLPALVNEAMDRSQWRKEG